MVLLPLLFETFLVTAIPKAALEVLSALFFPGSGSFRGMLAILSWAEFAHTKLQTATRGKALCMVVRSPYWKPQLGDNLENTIVRFPIVKDTLDLSKTTESDDVSKISSKMIRSTKYEEMLHIHTGVYHRKWHTER